MASSEEGFTTRGEGKDTTTSSSSSSSSSSPSLNNRPHLCEAYAMVVIEVDQSDLHLPVSTRTPPRISGNKIVWNEWITLPVKYHELSRHARCRLTVFNGVQDCASAPMVSTSFPLFTPLGVLKDGVAKLTMHHTSKKNQNTTNDSRNDEADKEDDHPRHHDEASETSRSETDQVLRLEKQRERYERNLMPKNSWLDTLVFRRMAAIRAESEAEEMRQRPLETECWVELPYFGAPVLYDQPLYHVPARTTYVTEGANNPSLARLVHDPDLGADNPFEKKYRTLAKDFLRGATVSDPTLKPNREEKAALETLLTKPCSQSLEPADKDLVWKFRHFLTSYPSGLTTFCLSVDWANATEVAHVADMLPHWKSQDKRRIEFADALKLLGHQREFQHDIVRKFAVETLSHARDEELVDYLLQLVQAMRYEQKESLEATKAPDATSDGLPPPHSSATHSLWRPLPPDASIGLLATFLIARACTSLMVANDFYWYLKVELEDATHGPMFRRVFRHMIVTLQASPTSGKIYDMLSAQDDIFSQIATLHHEVIVTTRGRKNEKEEALRQRLKRDLKWPKGLVVRMPLDPRIHLTGIVASGLRMFKSALYPVVLEFKTALLVATPACETMEGGTGQDDAATTTTSQGETACPAPPLPQPSSVLTPGPNYKVMFKNGDDLRQDQLVIQMFILMDRLLKKVNLDLQLTPYRVLAKSTSDGLMEFVTKSCPVAAVVTDFESPQITHFLRKHNPDKRAPYGIAPEALNTYVKSVAGYSVVTYLLAIGDRHLDNVMLRTDGHLFHIDFGCILGKDPKPYPPPFKLTKEMVEGMGGVASEHYQKFKTTCCQAYNQLRKSAPLILNLLNLMTHAGIEELSANPETTLAKVQERFRLDLTDEQAEQFFLSLINDSVTALFPVMMDMIHKVATKLR